ncbi:NAD(P)/FAD-dependent oxidoreductase [Undibacterium sp.]|uniref:NAD(P)/FAD-dependent oxidoreductase n=1 Tax=Undibacterium sp. TaxID=1914977 RepID=UPI00374DBE31
MDTPNINPKDNSFDAIIIGGSYSGLSAAMQLARARRRVLVIDAGLRRNRFAQKSHGFLGQDGRNAADIISDGKAQLLAYPNVSWMDGAVSDAVAQDQGFMVNAGGTPLYAKKLVLATGIIDELPAIEGLQERWGKSVFHCPYCHGYELDNGPIAVIASGPLSHHHAVMLPDWGRVTLLTNGAYVPDEEQLQQLEKRGVSIEPTLIKRLTGEAAVELVNGRTLEFNGMFTLTKTRVGSPLAEQLGCAFDEGPLGSVIRTEMTKATTVPGVFACGDGARMMGNVAMAVADGAMAGAATHQSLIFGG